MGAPQAHCSSHEQVAMHLHPHPLRQPACIPTSCLSHCLTAQQWMHCYLPKSNGDAFPVLNLMLCHPKRWIREPQRDIQNAGKLTEEREMDSLTQHLVTKQQYQAYRNHSQGQPPPCHQCPHSCSPPVETRDIGSFTSIEAQTLIACTETPEAASQVSLSSWTSNP